MARGTFGERLKRERELREVPLEEITLATRIGPRFLEALENEDWDKLPGGVFNRGFVRSIARYLGLDEEGFLAEYDLAHIELEQKLRSNIEFAYYPSGHMVYLNVDALKQLKADLSAFYAKAASGLEGKSN